jgi:zinc transport system substrate-binding protein
MYAILTEIVGNKADLHRLVPPGASPHAYAPKPSDLMKVEIADAIFYTNEMLDSWIIDFSNKSTIALFDFVPKDKLNFFVPHQHNHSENEHNDSSLAHEHDGHDHDGHNHDGHSHDTEAKTGNAKVENIDITGDSLVPDPHFWMSPNTVRAILPALLDTLSKLDPDNAAFYAANTDRFTKRLELLDKQIAKALAPHTGKTVFLFHPSMLYLLRDYKIIYGGSLEEIPGKEATANHIKLLADKINSAGAKSIFSEPQLSRAPAETLAEAANVAIYILDPVGGTEGKIRYADLILYNVNTLKVAL